MLCSWGIVFCNCFPTVVLLLWNQEDSSRLWRLSRTSPPPWRCICSVLRWQLLDWVCCTCKIKAWTRLPSDLIIQAFRAACSTREQMMLSTGLSYLALCGMWWFLRSDFFGCFLLLCRCCTKRAWGWGPPPPSLQRWRGSNATKRSVARYFAKTKHLL